MSWQHDIKRYGLTEARRIRREGHSTTRHRQRVYKVSPEMYNERLKSQGGLCAICKRQPRGDSRIKILVVDHDHEYGRLRDLLCAQCNRLLGQADDNPQILLEAASYLKKWKMKFIFGE